MHHLVTDNEFVLNHGILGSNIFLPDIRSNLAPCIGQVTMLPWMCPIESGPFDDYIYHSTHKPCYLGLQPVSNIRYVSFFQKFSSILQPLKAWSRKFANLLHTDTWDCDSREEVWKCDCIGGKLS
jgi:hypothetical protein